MPAVSDALIATTTFAPVASRPSRFPAEGARFTTACPNAPTQALSAERQLLILDREDREMIAKLVSWCRASHPAKLACFLAVAHRLERPGMLHCLSLKEGGRAELTGGNRCRPASTRAMLRGEGLGTIDGAHQCGTGDSAGFYP
jgi:hypothetical protein